MISEQILDSSVQIQIAEQIIDSAIKIHDCRTDP
jgi:hypothetical protein